MASAEIPEIRSLPNAVLRGVGEPVEVYLRVNNPDNEWGVPVQRLSNEMIRDVIDDMFQKLEIQSNRDLYILCTLAARIAVGKLVTSEGFNVEFGPHDETPRRILQVDLKRQQQVLEAEVTHSD